MTPQIPQETSCDVWVLSRCHTTGHTPEAARGLVQSLLDSGYAEHKDAEVICIGEKPALIQVYGQEYFENDDDFDYSEMGLQDPPKWDPDEDQERLCACGHPYHRHFDSYDEMKPIGCKFCPCQVPTLTDSYDIVGKYDKRPPTDLALAKTIYAPRKPSEKMTGPALNAGPFGFERKTKIHRTGISTWRSRWKEHRAAIREANKRGFD